MKALFLLIAIANIALLMWEYKNGALAKPVETTTSPSGQEQILLVRELPTTAPAPSSGQ